MPDTEYVYSYLEPRQGCKFPKTVFFGLQYLMKKYLAGQVVTKEKIDEAQKIIDEHLGKGVFNRKGWEIILRDYNGYLPIEIKAVPEGEAVDEGNVLVTVVNTDNRLPWLTGFVETILMNVWYPTTVATLSYYIKKTIIKNLKETGCDIENADWMLHNFGMRSASLQESAAVGSMAHLTCFRGTDTVSGLIPPMKFYHEKSVMGKSVYATEHSVMTQLGEEGELDVVRQILNNVEDDATVSIVIDSYDWKKFLYKVYDEFGKQILKRKGRVVFRPDSGNPVEVAKECVDILAKLYGYTTNGSGFKTLDKHIRVLYGDGINLDTINGIFDALKSNGYSAENVLFGMGGALLNGTTRDTQRFAFKCSARYSHSAWHDVFKKSDNKSSKPGRFSLIFDAETKKFKTIREEELPDETVDYLEVVFRNGKLFNEQSFKEIQTLIDFELIGEYEK